MHCDHNRIITGLAGGMPSLQTCLTFPLHIPSRNKVSWSWETPSSNPYAALSCIITPFALVTTAPVATVHVRSRIHTRSHCATLTYSHKCATHCPSARPQRNLQASTSACKIHLQGPPRFQFELDPSTTHDSHVATARRQDQLIALPSMCLLSFASTFHFRVKPAARLLNKYLAPHTPLMVQPVVHHSQRR